MLLAKKKQRHLGATLGRTKRIFPGRKGPVLFYSFHNDEENEEVISFLKMTFKLETTKKNKKKHPMKKVYTF